MGHAGMGWGESYQGGVGWELQGTKSRNAKGYQISQNNNGNAGY